MPAKFKKPKISVPETVVDPDAKTQKNSPVSEDEVVAERHGKKIFLLNESQFNTVMFSHPLEKTYPKTAAAPVTQVETLDKIQKTAKGLFELAHANLRAEKLLAAEKNFKAVLKTLEKIPDELLDLTDKIRKQNCDAQIIAIQLARVKKLLEDKNAAMVRANVLYAQNKFSIAEQKYQQVINILSEKNQIQWLTPKEQSDQDFCTNKITECKNIIKANAKLRDDAGFKKLDAVNAFEGLDYEKAADHYKEALKLLKKIKGKLTKDRDNILCCDINLKICLDKIKKQPRDDIKSASQYRFFKAVYNRARDKLKKRSDKCLLPYQKELLSLSKSVYSNSLKL